MGSGATLGTRSPASWRPDRRTDRLLSSRTIRDGRMYGQARPVWPKPPPRSSPSSESTTVQSTSSTRWITSWASRSPRLTTKGSCGSVFSRMTLELAAVRRIDQTRSVGHGQTVAQGVATARQDEPGVAGRNGDGDARGHQQPAAARCARRPSSRARRSRPASPGCAYDGSGRSGSSRTIGTDSTTCDSATPGRRVATLRAMVPPPRPPSVDALARAMSESGLPHAVCVELARQAIAEGPTAFERSAAINRANEFARSLLGPVINATGVLLHTNLGRAPFEMTSRTDGDEHRVRPAHRRARLATTRRRHVAGDAVRRAKRRWWSTTTRRRCCSCSRQSPAIDRSSSVAARASRSAAASASPT